MGENTKMKNKEIIYSSIIKTARESRRISQESLAQRIGVRKTTISNYETGYSNPNPEMVIKIASALGYTPAQMLELKHTKDNHLNLPRTYQGVNDVFIPYIKTSNVSISTISNNGYMDSYVTLPKFMLSDDGSYLCLTVVDNSMDADGIRRNDYVFIRKSVVFPTASVVLAVNLKTEEYIIRRYHADERRISLIPSSTSGDFPIISYDQDFPEYKIVGYVEKVLSNIK